MIATHSLDFFFVGLRDRRGRSDLRPPVDVNLLDLDVLGHVDDDGARPT